MYSSAQMPPTPLSIERELAAVLPAECIRSASAADAVCGIQPRLVLEPANEQQLAAVLRLANDANLAVIPRGGGTKLTWGNAPQRADLVLSTARLNQIIEHVWADLTVSVEAGCAVAALQSALAQHGQRLAIDPLWPERATIGGILSTNDSGALRLRFGALRDLIIGITIALPDGTLASSGGKVVKNVAGYDLPKLMTGAFGTLGVITRAIFRLHPLPRLTRTLTCQAGSLSEAQRLLLAIQDSQLVHSALQIRLIEDSPQPKIDILFDGTETGLAAQAAAFKSIVSPAPVVEAAPPVWNARQELHSATQRAPMKSAVAKFSTLPSRIESAAGTLCSIAASRVRYDAVVQATGIGHVLLRGEPTALASVLTSFRASLEYGGGSLVIHHQPDSLPHIDTWGASGDSLPLMRTLTSRFDPKRILNPGRFLGGI
jgi:glycolate oxidase FAD binding subunit